MHCEEEYFQITKNSEHNSPLVHSERYLTAGSICSFFDQLIDAWNTPLGARGVHRSHFHRGFKRFWKHQIKKQTSRWIV